MSVLRQRRAAAARSPQQRFAFCFLYFVLAWAIAIVIFATFPAAQGLIIYANVVRIPALRDLTDLRGRRLLPFTRNLRILTDDGITLGGWHLLPPGKDVLAAAHASVSADAAAAANPTPIAVVAAESPVDAVFDRSLRAAKTVVIFLHGNAATRGVKNRTALVRALAEQVGVHVLTWDYRGFGDSDGWPSQDGLIRDALAMWRYAAAAAPDAAIFLYGQSLGTAVATHLGAALAAAAAAGRNAERERQPAGIVLDAPFTDLVTAALHHPSGLLFRVVPGIHALLASRVHDRWRSVAAVATVGCPILILHGARDAMIPIDVGRQLFQAALAAHGPRRAAMFEFPEAGHVDIYTSPRWLVEMERFVEEATAAAAQVGGGDGTGDVGGGGCEGGWDGDATA